MSDLLASFSERFGPGAKALVRHTPLRRMPDGALGAFGMLVAVLIAVALWHWWPASAGSGFAITTATEAAASAQTTRPASGADADALQEAVSQAQAPATVTIDVCGAVNAPGVYELALGSRVVDAVQAAGGASGDAVTSAVNLARTLSDEEQVYIPREGEATVPATASAPSGSTAGSASNEGSGLVDINTATADELDALPGIGPSTAAKIIADRTANGPFSSIEDLQRVSGIGEKKYATLANLICAS